MMRIVHLEIFRNRMILFLILLTFSCETKIKTEEKKTIELEIKVMELEINSDLKDLLKADLNCLRKKYLGLFEKRPFFDLYAEKIENEYDIHVSTTKTLEIDKNCHGYFYIDTVIFTVYGEFVPELYENKIFKYLKVNNRNKNNQEKKKQSLVNEEIVSWHYTYKNAKVDYLIENTCFQVDR